MGDAVLFRRLEPLGHQARRFTSSPTPARGSIAGASASTRIRRPCAGSPAIASPALRRPVVARRTRRLLARRRPTRSATRSWSAPGAPSGGALAGALDHDDLDASVLLVAGARPPAGDRRTLSPHRCRSSARSSAATASSCAIPPRTTSARRRPPSSSASSGTSTRWPRSANRRRRASYSPTCFRAANSFGILSEDIHPGSGELWGNVPQTYCMAGIINTGMKLSRSWEDAWASRLAVAELLNRNQNHP